MPLPYYHETRNFTHSFIVILAESDVHSGVLAINHGRFASELLARDAVSLKLVDEESHPFEHLDNGGRWGSMVRIRNYQVGDHIMFGSPQVGNSFEIFVRKV